VRNPKRNLPLSLALGVGVVSILYIASNFVYLGALPLAGIQNAPEIGWRRRVSRMFGPAAVRIMAAAIMISTFGCANGIILSGARVYYAMALDGLFFRRAAVLDPRWKTPCSRWEFSAFGRSSHAQREIRRLARLCDLCCAAVLHLDDRWSLRAAPRQAGNGKTLPRYRIPVLPALLHSDRRLIEILLLIYKPDYTWPGLIIVLLGVPSIMYGERKG